MNKVGWLNLRISLCMIYLIQTHKAISMNCIYCYMIMLLDSLLKLGNVCSIFFICDFPWSYLPLEIHLLLSSYPVVYSIGELVEIDLSYSSAFYIIFLSLCYPPCFLFSTRLFQLIKVILWVTFVFIHRLWCGKGDTIGWVERGANFKCTQRLCKGLIKPKLFLFCIRRILMK